ncbi:MAG: hypothetical protein SangKO_027870 [Sandaracinaceae bacterium]
MVALGCTPPGACEDSCEFALDGECDDGRPGSITGYCALNTDCTDCASVTPPDAGARRRDAAPPDAGLVDAGPACIDRTSCAVLRTKREDRFCRSGALLLALGNDCDEDIECGVALQHSDGSFHHSRTATVRARTEAMFGFPGCTGARCGCGAPSGSRWVVTCGAPDSPAGCLAFD